MTKAQAASPTYPEMAWSLQVMLDVQLTSMKSYNPAGFGGDPGLHFITQRYAMLTTSLLLLNADYQVSGLSASHSLLPGGAPCSCRRALLTTAHVGAAEGHRKQVYRRVHIKALVEYLLAAWAPLGSHCRPAQDAVPALSIGAACLLGQMLEDVTLSSRQAEVLCIRMAAFQDGQMDHNIDRLRFAALELLIRLSKRFPRKRASTIFLVNNLHHIVQVDSLDVLYKSAGEDIFMSLLLCLRQLPEEVCLLCIWMKICSLEQLKMQQFLSTCLHYLPDGSVRLPVSHVVGAGMGYEALLCMQLLREAASRGGQMAHAAGTSPPPPTAPLGASGAETIKEFEASFLSEHRVLCVHWLHKSLPGLWKCYPP